MAEHIVLFEAPTLDVGRVDVIFKVKRNGRAHGRLKISQGGVEWMQRSDSKKAYHMGWNKLDQIFAKYGKKGKTRSKR